METVVFGNVTVMRLVLWAGGAVVLLVAFTILRRLLSAPRTSQHQQTTTCPACGWKGVVSRYAGRCPKCNGALGDKLARGKQT
ncbi:MAG: hypothetical protein ABIJ09_14185 [Pseudomonadota bacterium]